MAARPLAVLAALAALASGERVAASGERIAGKAVVEAHHPGHVASHVTRLHRYDHSGLAAMLEAEARWHGSAARATAPSPPSARSFVRLSPRQADALQQHHRETMLQVTAGGQGEERGEVSAAAVQRSVQQYQSYRRPAEGIPAVTGLSSLDSQYVGPIGVGTTLAPHGCTPASGQSLVFLGREEDSASKEDHASCHVEDQSKVWVVFDTGSTNIWVNSDLCLEGPCSMANRRRYNHSASATYTQPARGVQLHIEFGTGKITGPQAVDDFHIGPFSVYNQTFGMIQVQDGKVFEEVPFEGILGLAFPTMSANGVTPFFDNIVRQKALTRNEFAFYFSLDSPAANAVFWGGVDPTFYSGPIEYFNVVEPYYWSLSLLSFKIGQDELLPLLTSGGSFLERDGRTGGKAEYKAIVDTGTTFFTAEGRLYDEIMKRIPSTACSGIDEQSHPPLSYRLRGSSGEPRDFALTSSQYMTASGASGEDLCSPAFMRINIPRRHGPAMVLGEVFLRHFFSVFDRGDGEGKSARVGFAKAAHGDPAERRLKDLTRSQPAFAAGGHAAPE